MTTTARVSRKRSWVMPLVRRYAERRMRRTFEGMFVSGLEPARAMLGREPVLIAANHVSYWDPFVATVLDGRLGGDGYALMDADNLSRLWFFGAIGALPLRRGRPRDAHEDLATAASVLDAPGRSLWIFPQGRQRPAHLRPLELSSGVAWLARRAAVTTLPLSISYLYREAPEPAIFARFGPPLPVSGRATLLADLERALIEGLDRNDAAAMVPRDDYVPVWRVAGPRQVPWSGRLLLGRRRGYGDA